MFHKILPETRKLTMNKYGSRVVQTAFSYITQEQHAEWTKARAFFTHRDLFGEMRFNFYKNSGFPHHILL